MALLPFPLDYDPHIFSFKALIMATKFPCKEFWTTWDTVKSSVQSVSMVSPGNYISVHMTMSQVLFPDG